MWWRDMSIQSVGKNWGLLLNLGGNIYSNVNNSFQKHGSVLLFDIQVYDNIMHLNVKGNFENSNAWARYEYLKLKNSSTFA